MEIATETAAATLAEAGTSGADRASIAAVERLVSAAKYAPPKVVSFPIDALRVTGPISLAGNT